MIELRELSPEDGIDIYNMLQEIGPGENGFFNDGYKYPFDNFYEYLLDNYNASRGIELKLGHVPQTTFWLIVDGQPIGIAKLRSYLNYALRESGGHIGYSIRPSERNKGYGKILLKEALSKAKDIGIKEVLITCNEGNLGSRSVIEANSGKLEVIKEGLCKYWIKLSE
ncbi:GNAT family N-acetyltransferase [Clostridium sp. YIM B02505]|uniref:GNAT family N-acetyltransferase n=1 Tax=Clostridium yunnanense TaxID=2800325 RepID=A0ABS1EIA8_9CLOT|nr:GNAT family N-acetyltransferase [Clostridium yunnanense]MBK1809087.1 GNAT family N-acetyltransferase [Clostridium yunnanense]